MASLPSVTSSIMPVEMTQYNPIYIANSDKDYYNELYEKMIC